MALPRSEPFILIDDARAEGARPARLYRDPAGVIAARTLDEVEPAFAALRQARQRGLHAAGFIGYEAGYALEPRLRPLDPRRAKDDPPLLWFGLFGEYEEMAAGDVPALLEGGEGRPGPVRPDIHANEYGAMFDRIREWIIAGDIYQANLSFPCSVAMEGDPVACYGAVRSRAAAGHGALLFTGEHWLLSFSPEMFFALENGILTTRPMKGTALRDADPERDVANAHILAADPKQRAENLMIVDLLRNDLSRIAAPGSVQVPELFTVERYPTVYQMTSTVTARLEKGLDAVDALAALFPCGSITGAPKIRAMEILHEVERGPRGPYTGAIGHLDADGNAAFNVAIRTICVKDGAKEGAIGLGSGLVADSEMTSEWNECLDKGRFLSA